MKSPCVLHEDTFTEFFRPYRPSKTRHEIWGGLGLESYGKDWETIRAMPTTHVWTVMDSDVGPWIVPGIHSVNRICFLLTKKPHNLGRPCLQCRATTGLPQRSRPDTSNGNGSPTSVAH